MAELILYILGIVGTISFAVSGALVAIGAGLDLFGVAFVGWITAIGGGVLRDVLLGINPPSAFQDYKMSLIAIGVSLVVFIVIYFKKNYYLIRPKIDIINNFFDALGLAAFSVMGAEIAFLNGFDNNVFIVVLIGMITAVGGGIFRDIITDTTPYVFKKHIYALASIFGCIIYYYLRIYFNKTNWVSAITIFIIVLIRLLATKFCWSLPKIRFNNESDKKR